MKRILNIAGWAILILVIIYLWPKSHGSQNTESSGDSVSTRIQNAVSGQRPVQHSSSGNVTQGRPVGKIDLSIFGNQPTRPTNNCVETTIGEVWGEVQVANDSKKGYALVQEVSPDTAILFDQEHGWAWKKACFNRITPYEEQQAEEPAPAPEPVQQEVSQPEQPVQQPVCQQQVYEQPQSSGFFGIVTNFFQGRSCQQQDYCQPQYYGRQDNNCGQYRQPRQQYRQPCQQYRQPRQCYQPRRPICQPRPICPPRPICQPRPLCPPRPYCPPRTNYGGQQSSGGGYSGGGQQRGGYNGGQGGRRGGR